MATGDAYYGLGQNERKATRSNDQTFRTTAKKAPTLASATTLAPTVPVTFVSGTTAIVNITVPTRIGRSGGGQITLLPTGIFTWTAAGNIALAGTAVVGKALTFNYDKGTAKWYPNYIA